MSFKQLSTVPEDLDEVVARLATTDMMETVEAVMKHYGGGVNPKVVIDSCIRHMVSELTRVQPIHLDDELVKAVQKTTDRSGE